MTRGGNKPQECKGGLRGFAEKVIRVLMEQKKRQRDLEIWRRDDEFIALRRSVYRGDVGRRRKGGWRRGKSDRLDYESTHRRTLFNVSLTFLFSISSPPTLSRWRQMGRKEKLRESERRREGKRRNALPVLHSRSPVPDKVKGQGSWEGQPIRSWGSQGVRFPAPPQHNLLHGLFSPLPH